MSDWFFAGAPYLVGTDVPSNVTGECAHQHPTYDAAADCIARKDADIKTGHGRNAYCDRVVMVRTGPHRTDVEVAAYYEQAA